MIPLKNEKWPLTSLEAYERERGPFTVENATRLLDRNSFELYNGWLVLDIGTDFTGADVAANISAIVSTIARIRHFGRVLPDQVECELKNGDVIKPDACLVSNERSNTRVVPRGPDQKKVLQGGPELVVEFRLPDKIVAEEKFKRKLYFDNGTSIVWEIDPDLEFIKVWRAESPDQYTEFEGDDLIDCEPFWPGWRRPTRDFFDKELTTISCIVILLNRCGLMHNSNSCLNTNETGWNQNWFGIAC